MVKTVLVTGVSRGLGLATAARLLADREPYHVIGLSRSYSPAYQALVEGSAGRAEFIAFDVGDQLTHFTPFDVSFHARLQGKIGFIFGIHGITRTAAGGAIAVGRPLSAGSAQR